jgi:hypothetical protein
MDPVEARLDALAPKMNASFSVTAASLVFGEVAQLVS